MNAHPKAAVVRRTFWTPGTQALAFVAGLGLVAAVGRFVFGLGGVTNLDDSYPWGIWIAIDVTCGVALAAGGFTSAALAHVFHREHFAAIARPALLTAVLGYTFVVFGLLVDLGRPYNIWHPMVPWMANPSSVLFEVGLCVTIYLTVLYIEFLPVVCEHLGASARWPRIARIAHRLGAVAERWMFAFIILGVVLSCAHQSSLGGLLVIAPSKMHPLWWTPIQPLLFLLSAIAVGLPMVIVESLAAARSLRLPSEMPVLERLARIVPVLLGLYFAVKVGDLLIRESYRHLALDARSLAFVLEVGLGVALPLGLLMSARVRRSPKWLFTAALLAVLGVVMNRVNVFLVAYRPMSATATYFPALGEVLVTAGLICGLILAYRLVVTNLPVIAHEAPEGAHHADEEHAAHRPATKDLGLGGLLPGHAHGVSARQRS